MRISQKVKGLNVKPSTYYFHMKSKILADFQSCISVPLNSKEDTPVSQPYRKISKQLYNELKQYLEDLLSNQCIKESYTYYASPMVCVCKKNGTITLCIDYRQLNKKDLPDKMTLPRIQDILDNVGG